MGTGASEDALTSLQARSEGMLGIDFGSPDPQWSLQPLHHCSRPYIQVIPVYLPPIVLTAVSSVCICCQGPSHRMLGLLVPPTNTQVIPSYLPSIVLSAVYRVCVSVVQTSGIVCSVFVFLFPPTDIRAIPSYLPSIVLSAVYRVCVSVIQTPPIVCSVFVFLFPPTDIRAIPSYLPSIVLSAVYRVCVSVIQTPPIVCSVFVFLFPPTDIRVISKVIIVAISLPKGKLFFIWHWFNLH